MFKIGEFAKLTQVSVRMLRHYDELNLLTPVKVDEFTDYRYYSASQLPRLNRILALQDLGFTLKHIADLLDARVSADQLRGMLLLRQSELAQQLEDTHERLLRVAARLDMIDLEGKTTMTTQEVVVKSAPAMTVATTFERVQGYDNLSPIFNRLFDALFMHVNGKAKPAGPSFAWYHDKMDGQPFEIEAAVPIVPDALIQPHENLRMKTVAAEPTVASVIHMGSFVSIGQTYQALTKWIEKNGYRINGDPREVYLAYDRQGNPDEWVTEIQFPVIKI